MHIFFSYIGGGSINPLAIIAQQIGHTISGSDKSDSSPYIKLLKEKGVKDIGIGVTDEFIRQAHEKQPIDWYVYSSAVEKEFPNHPELVFCREHGIKMTKRDELLNLILEEKQLKLIAIAGTHGKTTTTAMAIWLLKKLSIPVSYSVGAKIGFGDMGQYETGSEYFVYECDEFDRNFLAFHPYISLISGISHDHHEIFPTKEDYNDAFRQFLGQSQKNVLWDEDAQRLQEQEGTNTQILHTSDPDIENIRLPGLYNRRDAWLVLQGLLKNNVVDKPIAELVAIMDEFPGISRRFEKVADNVYTDYAHTPEKISGAMSVAKETARKTGQEIVVIYEPLTNRRMHYLKDQHTDIFSDAKKLYWVPSFLAREDPSLNILSPEELITYLDSETQKIAEPAELNEALQEKIAAHLQEGCLVLALSGGGGKSLDDWVRATFGTH